MQNLPHSQEAEQSVLGCVLSKESLIADMIHNLTESDFYNPVHQGIYNIMLKLYNIFEVLKTNSKSNALDKTIAIIQTKKVPITHS